MTSRVVLVALAILGVGAALAGVALWPASNARAVDGSEPELVTRLALVADGQELALFSELGGVASGYEPSELELTSGPTPQLKLPGKRTPPTVVLKRGMTRNVELWAWHEQALDGVLSARKSASLVMYGSDGRPVARYTMVNAWPSKIMLGSLKAGSSEPVIEQVTIVSERIHRAE